MTDWKKYYLRFVGSAALNAGIFTAYRLYVHYRKNKLTYLELKDFKPYNAYAYKMLDFKGQEDTLDLINFDTVDDDLGEMQIAVFKYKDVFCSLYRYKDGNYKPKEYTLNIDIKGCADNNKTFKQVGEGFIQAIGFKEVNVTWINPSLDEVLENLIKNKK